MPEYAVEMYMARDAADAADAARRARRAAEDMAREGASVRFVRLLFMPEDETCFLLFEARDMTLVRAAAEQAGLQVDRVAETVSEIALMPQE